MARGVDRAVAQPVDRDRARQVGGPQQPPRADGRGARAARRTPWRSAVACRWSSCLARVSATRSTSLKPMRRLRRKCWSSSRLRASAAALLARRDWTPLVDAGRLGLIVGPKFSGASDAWRWVDARKAPPLVVPSAVLERVRPDAVAAARRILDRASFDASANAEARETLGGRYLVNTLRNLPRILAGPGSSDMGRDQEGTACRRVRRRAVAESQPARPAPVSRWRRA